MEQSKDIPAESTTTSLVSRDGKSLQPSGRDVAHRSTQIASESSTKLSNSQNQITVLMAILVGITENTLSGDVIALSVYRAKDICHNLGVDEDIFEDTVKRYLKFSADVKARHPMGSMF